MGRFLIGVGLLAAMLLLGVLVMFCMDRANMPISQLLEDAARTALAGDLEQGVFIARKAQKQWKHSWHTIASFSDHAPMDEIDSLFAQAAVYGQVGNTEDFASHCTRLAMLIEAVGEAHSLNWWNLLQITAYRQPA